MLKLNDTVKFKMFDNEYKVRACNERYAICVDEASKEEFYSIVDSKKDIRGIHNSWKHSTTTREECDEVLELLMDETSEMEISYRNNVPLDIESVNGNPV